MGDTVKPRLLSAEADLERVLVIDDADNLLTLADERIENAIRENRTTPVWLSLTSCRPFLEPMWI